MGDEAIDQFLDAYDRHRVGDQIRFYGEREDEYRKADRQAGALGEALLFLAGVAGLVAAVWVDQALWLGIAAATLAALAALVGSWSDLIGFSKNASLYSAASSALGLLHPERPRGPGADPEAVAEYVTHVEAILLGEVRTWGEQWSVEGGKPDG